jgi:hypothetical protein
LAFDPSKLAKSPDKDCHIRLKFRINRNAIHEYADPPHSTKLLRPRRERQRRTTEPRDELSPPHRSSPEAEDSLSRAGQPSLASTGFDVEERL